MLTPVRCQFHPVTTMARKRPRSFCKKVQVAGYAYTLDATKSEWADYGNKLTRNSFGSTRPQSSQLVELLWIDPGLKCGIDVRELISA